MAPVQGPGFQHRPWPALLHGSPPLPHTQLWPTAGLVPGQMKTHTITHTLLSWVGERGKQHPRYDWTADSELCLKFFMWTQLEIFKCDILMAVCTIEVKNWVFFFCHTLFERLPMFCWVSLEWVALLRWGLLAFGKTLRARLQTRVYKPSNPVQLNRDKLLRLVS